MTVSLILMAYNPGQMFSLWISAIKQQSISVNILIVDSSSTDGTNFSDLPRNFQVKYVASEDFNHGSTRNLALQYVASNTEIVIFMTQDAMLEGPYALQALLAAFDDPTVACAYGRQLPYADATPLAAHARAFNYPSKSQTISMADRSRLGIKACFLSNSFAAYRYADLVAIGSFPANVILGEDMSVAARLLMAGKRIAYVASASVYHSHNYSTVQEFRRYFDTGVFHARSPWLLQTFGKTRDEGMRFVRSELNYLWKFAPTWIPYAVVRTLIKWLGYKLGQCEPSLPLFIKRGCSMHKNYWG